MKYFVGYLLPLVVLCAGFALAAEIENAGKTAVDSSTNIPAIVVGDTNDTTTAPETTTASTTPPTTTVSPSPDPTTPNTTTSSTTTPFTTTSSEKPTKPPTTTSSTTVSPIPITTEVPPTPPPKHWSTTSFIGGMVFAFGMVAIAFVAFKFYKARNERNYHTL